MHLRASGWDRPCLQRGQLPAPTRRRRKRRRRQQL